MKFSVLLVEDDTSLARILTERLEREGYIAETCADGESVFSRISQNDFDLVILDVTLPGKSGFEICCELRGQGYHVPILILTARGSLTDRVTGLKLGADDYLAKPFEVPELLARMEALLRRTRRHEPEEVFHFGDCVVDFGKKLVKRQGAALDLSVKEFQLLCYLIHQKGKTVSRKELLREVWHYGSSANTRTVDVHVAQLRQKLEANPQNPQHVVTVHGFGYMFSDDSDFASTSSSK
jgi:two-component system, OmpR family, alkaline phosphatase synthesis response regulator PhoP